MADDDRVTARALVETGYMPLRAYLERFGNCSDPDRIDSPSTAPDTCETSESILQAYVFTVTEER